ncbi:MAG: Histidine kinase, gyrase and HSP90-like ATPase [Candidatus Parcubacteria bacterium]|jgi:hypothetical protein
MTTHTTRKPLKPLRRRHKSGSGNSHAIGFHHGAALMRLASAYPTLVKTFAEGVQNAVDVDVMASRIEIEVNRRLRFATISDNGKGTTPTKFGQALDTVATTNRKGVDAIGQFGIGLISPLGKCERFTFTSRPRRGADRKYRRWTFDCKAIAATERDPEIPVQVLTDADLPEGCWWSSQLRMEGLSTDRAIANIDIDQLVATITSTLAIVMRRLRTVLSIRIIEEDGSVTERKDVKAPEYTGEALPVHVVPTETGKVTFRLYRRVTKGRHIKQRTEVLVGRDGDDFRFPIKHLRISGLFPEGILTHLTSGLFEGEIVAEGVTLRAERQAFEQDAGYLDLGVAVEKWYAEIGKQWVDEAKDDSKAVRHQQLAVRSMSVVESMLAMPAYAHLKTSVVDKFKFGHVGETHAPTPKAKRPEGFSGITTGGGVGRDRSTEKGEGSARTPTDGRTSKDGHSPMAVAGPKGQKRHFVRGHSTGLIFDHQMLDEPNLYQFDPETGILTFNTRHPAWVLADEGNDQAIMRLQEYIAIQVLLCHAQPESVRATIQDSIEYGAAALAVWFTSADGIRRSTHDVKLAD